MSLQVLAVKRDALGLLRTRSISTLRSTRFQPETRGDLAFLVMRAGVSLDRGDYAGALRDCDQAILQGPLQAEAYRNRGIARIGLGGAGNANLAIEDFGAYIRLRPQDREGYWRRATIELDLSKIKPAILDLDRAIQIGPPDAAMHRERARAYLLDGQKDRALVALGEAIRLDPADTVALRARVDLLVEANSFAAALSDCDKLVALAPNDPDAYCFRSWALVRAGQGEKALADAEVAIRLAPDRAWPYYTRGLARTDDAPRPPRGDRRPGPGHRARPAVRPGL